MNKLLNIILLTYNKLDYTKKCIENIYKYTEDFNLIIVDQGSDGDTKNFLEKLDKEHNNLIIQYNKENIGIIKGRNLGYFLSQKKYPNAQHIFFLDSDQMVLENWQKSYFEFFEKGYDVVGSVAWKMRNKDFYPYKIVKNKNEEFSYVGIGGLLIRSSVFEELGRFSENYNFMYFEDPHLCFEAYNKGYKVGWNYNEVIFHEKHNLSLKGERKKYFMENWKKFREKWEGYKIPKFKME